MNLNLVLLARNGILYSCPNRLAALIQPDRHGPGGNLSCTALLPLDRPKIAVSDPDPGGSLGGF